jgi:hypothetical protein
LAIGLLEGSPVAVEFFFGSRTAAISRQAMGMNKKETFFFREPCPRETDTHLSNL